MKKKIILGIAAFLTALALFFGLKNLKKTSPFKVETVGVGEMAVSISASGEIAAERDATLQFQTGGLLSWVGVQKGDRVRQGQAVASLDSRQLKKQLQKSLNLYQSERDDFEQTQADYQETKDKYLLTDEIRRILDKTQNSLNNTVLDVELNDLAIRYSTLYSPFAGEVVAISAPFAGVNILPTTASFRIVDPQSLYFQALIDETDIPKVKVGRQVKVRLDAFPDQIFKATVSKIDLNSSLSSGGGTAYQTKITFPAGTEEFRLGMNGDAEIILESLPKALLVPFSALAEKEGQTYLWKVEKNRAKKVEVKIGATNDDFAQVTEGITEGERVITGSISLLKEGMAIKP